MGPGVVLGEGQGCLAGGQGAGGVWRGDTVGARGYQEEPTGIHPEGSVRSEHVSSPRAGVEVQADTGIDLPGRVTLCTGPVSP